MIQNCLRTLWDDDGGAVITPEWIMVSTILVIGVLTGFIAVRQTVMARAIDLANHAQVSNQSYSFSGQASCEQILYVRFATLTTTGYGDIVEAHPRMQRLCKIESMIGEV